MSKFLSLVEDIGLLPLVVLENPEDAIPLGKALVEGGIPIAEVTFRTDAAAQVIKQMSDNVPGLIVGAGTVHNVEQAKQAVENGAEFIVTPGIEEDVVVWCNENNIPIVPGCISPSDVESALKLGLSTLKFFPAEAYGGIKTLKALYGPYRDVKFVPTGGINDDNLNDYLQQQNVAAVGGSFVLPNNLVSAKKWDEISKLCKSYVHKVLGFEIGHLGINAPDENAANNVALQIANLFDLPTNNGNSSIFVSELFEVMKSPYYGDYGHLAINTIDIVRAVKFFERNNIGFIEETKKYDDDGNLIVVYLDAEISGFAFHLRQKA